MLRCRATSLLLLSGALLGALTGPASVRAAEPLPEQLKGVGISEKLGQRIDLDLAFFDERGERVTLRQLFAGDKPVLLTLNYFRCKMLCSMQLNAVAKGLKGLGWVPGGRFKVVTVSIDPRDTATVAKGKRANYLSTVGIEGADWRFLVTGKDDKNVKVLAESLGFNYRYIEKDDQYAHAAAIFFLAPDGKISRYLYGVGYAPREIKFALVDASAGRVGSTVDKVIFSCFNYDPATGRYSVFAWGVMRLAGGASALVLGIVLALLWRRERGRHRHAEESA